MNSRLEKFRDCLSAENRNNLKKRKREGLESEPPIKRPNLLRDHDDRPRLQSYPSDEADVHSWDREPTEQRREQTKRYSANRRLKLIRRSIEESKQSAEVVHKQLPVTPPNRSQPVVHKYPSVTPPNKSQPVVHKYPPVTSPNNSQPVVRKYPPVTSPSKSQSVVHKHLRVTPSSNSQSDPSCSSAPLQTNTQPGIFSNQRTGTVVTAKPSSLTERLSKIRNHDSFNKVLNEHNRRSMPLNTVGGGWFKSVDVEARNNNVGDKMASPSNAVDRNLGADMPFIIDNRNHNRTRENRSANEALLSNNDFDKNNTSTFTESGVSSFPDCVKSHPSSGSSIGIDAITHSDISDMAMDWQSSEEKEVVSNLQELRKTVQIASPTPKTPFQEVVAKESKEIEHNKMLLKTIYIVVDTNIFLSHIQVVDRIMNRLKINGTNIGVVTPIILVPWIVVQELDYIKDGRHNYNLKKKAQQAVRFINECLCDKTNLKGQSVRDAAEQDFASSNFDDSILHCCLQIRERRNRAILLSNDINLRNKLMNEDFEAFSHDKIFKKLDPYGLSCPEPNRIAASSVVENEKIKEIQTHLSHLCTFIILKELKAAYGELWNKIGSTKKIMPWSFQDCLDLFEQYWIPVFQMKVAKCCLKHIAGVNKSSRMRNETFTDPKKLLEFGLTLCIYLKTAYSCYFDVIVECVQMLQKIYDSI